MKHQTSNSRQKLLVLLLVVASSFFCQLAHSQSWNYQAYNQNGPTAGGYITLEEKNGAYSFQMFAGRLDICLRAPLKASVERTESTIVITPVPILQDCRIIRFVIKSDGTGGIREVKEEAGWVPDGFERMLTLRK